jgi:hypothetical protein
MKRNLELREGVTTVIPVVARDDSGAVVDLSGLTGSAITWKLALTADITPDITKTIGSGITVTDVTGGEFSITISGTDLTDLCGYYIHQCTVSKAGVVYLAIFGNARVDRSIDL